MWSFLIQHNTFHTHSLWNDEDIGEYDCCVYEAGETFNGLEGYCGCDLWVAAAFEKITVSFCFMILGKVSTSYLTAISVLSEGLKKEKSFCLPWRITHTGARSTFSPEMYLLESQLQEPRIANLCTSCCTKQQVILQWRKLFRHCRLFVCVDVFKCSSKKAASSLTLFSDIGVDPD